MHLSQLLDNLDLRLTRGEASLSVSDLTDDSRQVTPGSLFIARSGTVAHGGAFIEEALRRGAAAVLAPSDTPATQGPAAWITGERIDQALCGELAERFFDRPSQKLKIVGVTGTKGKTTVTFVVQHLLGCAGVKCGLIGTVRLDDGQTRRAAELTTPSAIDLSRLLARMVSHGCGAAAIELSSHALHQGRAAALSLDVGVFTNLTGDHLDYHKTMEDYAAAKAILFESLKPQAWAVLNVDDPWHTRMLQNCNARLARCTMRGGERRHSDAQAQVLAPGSDHTRTRVEGPWGSVEVRLPLVGDHNVMNVLQATAGANCVTAMARYVRAALNDCPAPPGRLEPVRLAESAEQPTVLVDYAHTHDALDNVLRALRPFCKGRLVVVFGCGGDRDKTKRPKMAAVACHRADRVVVTSDNPRTEDPSAIIDDILAGVPGDRVWEDRRTARDESSAQRCSSDAALVVEPDRAKAIELAVLGARAQDTVVLAGKGHEDYQIIGKTKRHFDDREQALAALSRWREQRAALAGA